MALRTHRTHKSEEGSNLDPAPGAETSIVESKRRSKGWRIFYAGVGLLAIGGAVGAGIGLSGQSKAPNPRRTPSATAPKHPSTAPTTRVSDINFNRAPAVVNLCRTVSAPVIARLVESHISDAQNVRVGTCDQLSGSDPSIVDGALWNVQYDAEGVQVDSQFNVSMTQVKGVSVSDGVVLGHQFDTFHRQPVTESGGSAGNVVIPIDGHYLLSTEGVVASPSDSSHIIQAEQATATFLEQQVLPRFFPA